MVNRAELVEKAARTSHRWGLDFGGEHAEWDELRESTRREYPTARTLLLHNGPLTVVWSPS